jgi:uncharacterized membrane protein
MEIAIVCILYIVVIIIDVVPFMKKNKWKERVIYLVVLVFTFSILILDSLDIKAPSPATLIKYVITKTIGGM